MKVLICGSYGAYTLNLISRLKAENVDIYAITGSRQKGKRRVKEVFQDYNFLYTDAAIPRVIDNIKPDAVVFTGAMDSIYDGNEENKQAVGLMSGFSNVLIASKNAGVKKLIYISSLSIFSGNNESLIQSDTVPKPVSDKEKAILQCENLCEYYHEEGRLEISAVRVGTVYGSFGKEVIQGNIVEKMLLSAISKNKIQADEKKEHYLTYVSDAVDAVLKVVLSRARYSSIYVVPGQTITEKEIAEEIARENNVQKGATTEIVAVNSGNGKHREFELDGEQGFSLKHELREGIKKVYRVQAKSSKKKDIQAKDNTVWKKLMPFVETVFWFLIAHGLRMVIGDTWVTQTVNIYLIYVAVIAVTHGVWQGLLACLLSIIGNYSLLIAQDSFLAILADYTKYLWVLQLLTIGVLTGYLRDTYKRKTDDLQEDNRYLKEEKDNISRINDSNVQAKNIYEKRLINYKDSLAKMYDITTELDRLEPQTVLFSAVNVIKRIMETNDVAIYTRSADSDYFRLIASSSDLAKTVGKTLRYDENLSFYEALQEQEIYRNKTMAQNSPTLAGALYNGDRVEIIIMVWHLDFQKLNLYQSNLLAVLCRLIEKPLARAYTYMESLYKDAFLDDTRVMKPDAFQGIIGLYQEGNKQGFVDYTLLSVQESSPKVLKKISGLVRESDYIGLDLKDNCFVLLTNSNSHESRVVLARLAQSQILAKRLS